jgi:anti-anti-sigma factor
MALRINEQANKHFHIRIEGHFVFDGYREFLDAVNELAAHALEATVDLTRVEYMDTAGLGLLLTMRNRLSTGRINLKVCEGSQVCHTLKVANLSRLFAIEAI